MIESRIVNNSFTEIYVGGGVNTLLTESYPTNFHTFLPRRILTGGDSIDNYREVTAAERAAIEAADAKWVLPPQLFIYMWNIACGKYGRYNKATGYFELNGIKNITYAEALEIYEHAYLRWPYPSPFSSEAKVRTNLVAPLNYWGAGTCPHLGQTVCNWSIEVLRVCGDNEMIAPSSVDRFALNMHNLREVKGIISAKNSNTYLTFTGCERLVTFWLRDVHTDVYMQTDSCKQFSRETIAYMVEMATNTKSITFTVHPDVYAKLTGDITDKAAAALTEEELAQWQEVIAAAEAKNILFATI